MEANFEMAFLISSERSGSNLITKIIDAHPDYCGPAPSHLIRTFCYNILKYGNLKGDANWRALLKDAADLMNAQLGIWKTGWNFEKLLDNVHEHTLAAVISHIYQQEAIANGKQHAFIKENHTQTFLPFLLASFPSTRIIYLVRDPRDMALSWKLSPNHPGSMVKAASVWKSDQKRGIEIYGYLKDAGKILLVKYEDLVSKPEAIRSIADFLEVSFHPSMMEFYKGDLTQKNANRLKNWNNLGKPLLKNNFNKFMGKLSESEIRYVEHICADEMEFLGYEPIYQPLGNIKPVLQEVGDMEGKVQKAEIVMTEDEKQIREKRLGIIKRIINRNLPTAHS